MKLQGMFASAATPFDHTGAIYRAKIQHNFDKWCRTSLAGFVIGGMTGEGPLLEPHEKIDVLRLAMRESVGVSDTEFDQLRIGPGWKHLLGVAPAVPYDWKIWEERFDPQRLAALKIPVLVLLGSESPSWIRTSTEAVHGVIPGAMLSLLPGQEHFAMLTAPELFAQQVTSFALQHCQP